MNTLLPSIAEEAEMLAPIFVARNGDVAELVSALDPAGFPHFRLAIEHLRNGQDPAMVLSWLPLEDRVAIMGSSPEAQLEPPLNVLTADQILAAVFPPMKWAIPGILPVGLTMLAGRPKVGKSWLALQFAHAIAAGGITLGEPVERGSVLYLALEDPPRRLQKRMRQQQWQPGVAPVHFVVLGQFDGQIGDLGKGGSERLVRQIETVGYRLVVIDTFSRAFRTKQNDADEVTAAMAPVQEMAHKCDCAVLLLDHHRKGQNGTGDDAGSFDPIDDIMGSTAKGAMVDGALGLYRGRGKAGTFLHMRGREVEDRRLAIVFDQLTGSWQLSGEGGDEQLTPKRRQVLDAIKRQGPCTLAQVCAAIGDDNDGNVWKVLEWLVQAGFLRVDGVQAAPGGREVQVYSAVPRKNTEG